jgi:1-acyl-sn-glycerol-3-phosphate acyltransferase
VPPSVDVLAVVAVETLKVSVPTIVQAAAGTLTTEVCNERLDAWSKNIVRYLGLRVDVRGRENIVPGEAFVVMSNHQSHFDIPVLFQALRIPLRMVAKTELFKIPFMSGAMRAAGFVEVDRKNRASAISTLSNARDRLSDTVSIWIAPEGTRSVTGKLGPFKKGGFHLAIGSKMRILPVSIEGTRFALPAHGLNVTKRVAVSVTIGKPIDPADFGPNPMKPLIAAVRAAIEAPLPAELKA